MILKLTRSMIWVLLTTTSVSLSTAQVVVPSGVTTKSSSVKLTETMLDIAAEIPIRPLVITDGYNPNRKNKNSLHKKSPGYAFDFRLQGEKSLFDYRSRVTKEMQPEVDKLNAWSKSGGLDAWKKKWNIKEFLIEVPSKFYVKNKKGKKKWVKSKSKQSTLYAAVKKALDKTLHKYIKRTNVKGLHGHVGFADIKVKKGDDEKIKEELVAEEITSTTKANKKKRVPLLERLGIKKARKAEAAVVEVEVKKVEPEVVKDTVSVGSWVDQSLDSLSREGGEIKSGEMNGENGKKYFVTITTDMDQPKVTTTTTTTTKVDTETFDSDPFDKPKSIRGARTVRDVISYGATKEKINSGSNIEYAALWDICLSYLDDAMWADFGREPTKQEKARARSTWAKIATGCNDKRVERHQVLAIATAIYITNNANLMDELRHKITTLSVDASDLIHKAVMFKPHFLVAMYNGQVDVDKRKNEMIERAKIVQKKIIHP